MQLVNASGTVVASYEYDPYGNIVSSSGAMDEINPLRYRGYYYDSESGLYYLQSRYYDPQVGRFINADALVSTGQGLLGNNMFAYCNNSPVIMVDDCGSSSTVAGAIIGGIFGLINGLMSGGSVEDVLTSTVSGAVNGAIAGFIADVSVATFGVGGAIIGSAIGGGIAGAANSIVTQSSQNDGSIDAGKVVSEFVFGAIAGGLCTAVGDIGKPVAKGIAEGIRHVGVQLFVEEGLVLSGNLLATNLLFDVGAAAVTSFGSWAFGLAFDAKTS